VIHLFKDHMDAGATGDPANIFLLRITRFADIGNIIMFLSREGRSIFDNFLKT